MLLATESNLSSSLLSTRDIPESSVFSSMPFDQCKQHKMISRNGSKVSVGPANISIALNRAYPSGIAAGRRLSLVGTALAAQRDLANENVWGGLNLPSIHNMQNWNTKVYGALADMRCWV